MTRFYGNFFFEIISRLRKIDKSEEMIGEGGTFSRYLEDSSNIFPSDVEFNHYLHYGSRVKPRNSEFQGTGQFLYSLAGFFYCQCE